MKIHSLLVVQCFVETFTAVSADDVVMIAHGVVMHEAIKIPDPTVVGEFLAFN